MNTMIGFASHFYVAAVGWKPC